MEKREHFERFRRSLKSPRSSSRSSHKPIANVFRRFGTSMNYILPTPRNQSLDGRGVGTSMNNIRVLRTPNFRVTTVKNIEREIERKKVMEDSHKKALKTLNSLKTLTSNRPPPSVRKTRKSNHHSNKHLNKHLNDSKKNSPKPGYRPKPSIRKSQGILD